MEWRRLSGERGWFACCWLPEVSGSGWTKKWTDLVHREFSAHIFGHDETVKVEHVWRGSQGKIAFFHCLFFQVYCSVWIQIPLIAWVHASFPLALFVYFAMAACVLIPVPAWLWLCRHCSPDDPSEKHLPSLHQSEDHL